MAKWGDASLAGKVDVNKIAVGGGVHLAIDASLYAYMRVCFGRLTTKVVP